MGKLPAILLYDGDWLKDSIAGCSLAAQGLWLRMMFIGHNSERYGYLQQNGVPIPPESIARRCGCTLAEYTTLLCELDAASVPSRTPEGIIFSRRMVRDAADRAQDKLRKRKQRANGTGTNPKGWTVTRVSILKRDGYLCAYCGADADTVDHVLPASRGGGDEESNLVACCSACNSIKNNRTPKEAGMAFLVCPPSVPPLSAIEDVNVKEVGFGLEAFDFEEAFNKLCEIYPRSDRSYIAQTNFIKAVESVSKRKKLRRSEAAAYILSRTEIYVSKCKFISGLTKYLDSEIYDQNESMWETVVQSGTAKQRAVMDAIDKA